ncbi:heat shock factor protein 1-like [Antedon mediterranea]|uniref:heat shock factor protein 1-like n=1 Tax=Antedon mediterranea TaxID=105859 RepID=UPI003AF5345D
MDNTASSVPAFINKLWMLVEDKVTDDYIEWSETGTSFCVLDQSGFAKTVLPLYFKHNNMASFVRQLNMYGFRKVSYPEQGGMRYDGDAIEFQHLFFRRGQKELLEEIKRKGTSKEDIKVKANDVTKVLTEVQELKGKQEDMDSRLTAMKRENEGLWQEVITLRQKHSKQQQVVHRLIQFLMSIIPQRPVKRKRPLMIQDAAQNPKTRKQMPTFETASSSIASALQPSSAAATEQFFSELLNPLGDAFQVNASSTDSLTPPDEVLLPAVDGPEATLTELTEPIIQSPSEIQNFDIVSPSSNTNSDVVTEIEPSESLEFLQDIPLQTVSRNGDKKHTEPSNSLVLQRPLSVDEHKQELSEHIENVQSNIEFIHEMLTNGQYSLDPDTLLPVFYPEPFDQDFLSKLAAAPDGKHSGNELVEYQPISNAQFDGDSLLSSFLNTDDSTDDATNEEQLA